MGVKKILKSRAFSGLNVFKMMSLSTMKNDMRFLGQLFKGLLKRHSTKSTATETASASDSAVIDETFEQTLSRYGVSEKDLIDRIRSGYKILSLYLFSAVAVLVYMFYLFSQVMIIAGIITFVLGMLFLVYAFREHITLFRLRQRDMGCDVRQWFNATFLRKSL